MRITNLSFPYPVLGVKDDVQGQHKVETKIRLTPEDIRLSISHVLFNETIEDLIRKKKASFCAQLICPKTFFRQTYLSSDKAQEVSVPHDQLRDNVSVEFFTIANRDMSDYSNKRSHKDYSGYRFFVGKADVLSFGGTFSFVASKQWMTNRSISSFMSIRCGDFDKGPMKIDLMSSSGKIVAELSRSDFDKYRNNYKNETFYPIYHSCIVFPALIYAVTQMLLPEDRDSYADCFWFQVLDEMRKTDKKLQDIGWDLANTAEIVQCILDNPINRAFNSMDELVQEESED